MDGRQAGRQSSERGAAAAAAAHHMHTQQRTGLREARGLRGAHTARTAFFAHTGSRAAYPIPGAGGGHLLYTMPCTPTPHRCAEPRPISEGHPPPHSHSSWRPPSPLSSALLLSSLSHSCPCGANTVEQGSSLAPPTASLSTLTGHLLPPLPACLRSGLCGAVGAHAPTPPLAAVGTRGTL